MERGSRIWLGIFTFLPIVLLFIYLGLFAVMVKDVVLYGDDISTMADVGLALLLMLVIGILAFGLFFYYVIHVINSKADGNEKLLWIILFFVGNIFAYPVYWYMRIWRSPGHDVSMLAN